MTKPKQSGKQNTPKKMGRPRTYSQKTADLFLRLMQAGGSVNKICEREDMPTIDTIHYWRATRPDFLSEYARARVEQMHAWADDTIGLADDAIGDFRITVPVEETEKTVKNGKVTFRLDRKHIARAELQIKTRQWLMSRFAPDDFGDKSTVNVNVAYEGKDDDELMSDLQQAAEKAGVSPEQMVAYLGESGTMQ